MARDPKESALLVRLHEVAPSWERAVFLYGGEPQLGGHRTRKYLVLLAPSAKASERSCRECGYRWLVKPDPGLNIVPQCCPKCRGAMRWRVAEEPETYVTVAPGSGISPQDLVEWTLDFERWLGMHTTKAMPDPVMLVKLWCRGHWNGKPPSYRELAEALENHLGLDKRPHPQSVWRVWRGMRGKYEGKKRSLSTCQLSSNKAFVKTTYP